MISVRFDPLKLTGEKLRWWKTWQKRADAATLDAIKAWEEWRRAYASGKASAAKFKYEFDEKIWGDLKDWLLLNVFNNKCAYCETPVGRSQFHAEHFRPKGQVKTKKQVVTIQTLEGQQFDHPGYFWLAYNWENLLPSCALCNTVKGKKNQFPIILTHASMWKSLTSEQERQLKRKIIKSQDKGLKSVYYLQPIDLDVFEGRLLLHPYLDDPHQHLRFGESGSVAAVEGSEMGKHSIEVYDLDNGPLDSMRHEAQLKALNKFLIAFLDTEGTVSNKIRASETAIARFRKGKEPYSAAALDYIELVRKRLQMPAPGRQTATVAPHGAAVRPRVGVQASGRH
jgi:hypothetical protein